MNITVANGKLSIYDKRVWELLTLIGEGDGETDEVFEWLDQQVQAAFQRGMGILKSRAETDAVSSAQQSGITDSDTLSNLYSKEQGFKP